jgi:hypothetical protein
VTVAATPETRSAPPTPEECDHPAPVVGVLAHEFSPYRGAQGPEGKRRTTMYYGPVVGALPIRAWHCERCGLLRLEYYDGRREERRLYPGAQPGLLALAVAEDAAPAASRGVQASVSGLSLPAELEAVLIPRAEPVRIRIPLPRIELPDLGWVTWTVVVLLVATIVQLVLLMYGAVYDWKTAGWVGPLAVSTAVTFGAAALIPVVVAGFRHFFAWPQLAPSPAEVYGGHPQMDGVTWTVVTLLVIVMLGLAVAGILAIYDWRTPGALRPFVVALGVIFGVGVVVGIAGFANRRLAQRS